MLYYWFINIEAMNQVWNGIPVKLLQQLQVLVQHFCTMCTNCIQNNISITYINTICNNFIINIINAHFIIFYIICICNKETTNILQKLLIKYYFIEQFLVMSECFWLLIKMMEKRIIYNNKIYTLSVYYTFWNESFYYIYIHYNKSVSLLKGNVKIKNMYIHF